MNPKYQRMRLDLEAAREQLDQHDELDQNLGLIIDSVIETILALEYRKGPAEVIPFTPRRRVVSASGGPDRRA